MADDEITYERIKQIVHEMDEGLTDESDPAFRIAALLLSSLQVGPDVIALTVYTGEHAEWIASIADRLVRSKVWTADGKVQANWFDDETGGIEFWMDVAVGNGLVERA